MLVLNASYEPINVCTVRRAAVLILKKRAEVLEKGDWALHAENLTLPRPVVIRLLTYVRIPRDAHRRKITRRAVFARDRWTCQYCGHERGNLTVDHVIPRSKGGPLHLGEHRHLLRALQPPQGRPPAEAGEHGARAQAEGAEPDDLHPRGHADDSRGVGAVPGGGRVSGEPPPGAAALRRRPTSEDDRPATVADLRSLAAGCIVAAVWAVAATALGVIALIAGEQGRHRPTRPSRRRACRASKAANSPTASTTSNAQLRRPAHLRRRVEARRPHEGRRGRRGQEPRPDIDKLSGRVDALETQVDASRERVDARAIQRH